MTKRKRADNPSNSIMSDLWKSIFEPGINRGVIIAMHATFLSLIVSLVSLLVISGEYRNPHIWLLFIIVLFVYGAMTW